ncbi:carboxylesterase family protein [Streptomyces chartreusis]|uniref:carboxylesterase/lipase family protein n=1 Tax=Streptomyces chartreusis TaxID=1969 RepID=UPI002F9131E4|nr:carboxylesterase family protein [Streptomyces chartreusis]WTA33454.1 carboxylesterase family protein [Streptomyces chartreusis]
MVSPARITVSSGRLEGNTTPDGRVRAFLGVPYAAPPVGELRWRPPQPVQPWSGTRSAQRHAPSAPQPLVPSNSLYCGGEREFSEDCLYLNVWTGPAGDVGRPVLVWLHFGGFQFGSASNPLYDGTVLAREGATVVGVNYRLGRLGFLAHPALSAESDHGVSGNFGMLDQIAALQWVRDNVEAFGGDPTKVTVMGVSAGGHSVHNLRASDLASGLFHRAVVHSGPGVAPVLHGPGHPANPQSLAAGEQAGSEVADLLGVRTAAQLRSVPAEALAEVVLPRAEGPWTFDLSPGASASMHIFDSAYPVVDGYVLRESPLTAYESGRALDVPMIVGNVGNEGSGLPCLTRLRDYHEYVHREYGPHADRLLRLYPAASDGDVPAASRALEADRVFVWSGWTAARLQSRGGGCPIRHYMFLRQPPIGADSDVAEKSFAAAFHGADLPYLFGTYDVWNWPWTAADRTLGRQLRAAWLAFADTGDPTSGDSSLQLPSWPEFAEDAPTTMVWGLPAPIVSDVISRERMAAFDEINKTVEDATT